MLDDILDYQQHIQERPVWQPMLAEVREGFAHNLPLTPATLEQVHDEFMRKILPYTTGNVHPGFLGWVHGGGTPVGLLAEMLAAGLNANLGGRDHAPIEVEKQITRWMRELFGFPGTSSGLLVTGTSMANFIAVLVARNWALGLHTRRCGVASNPTRLTAYASTAAHGSLRRAFDFCGLGSDSLRLVPVDADHRIKLDELRSLIAQDCLSGYMPFLVAGTAGTVDIGAIDDLDELAGFCRAESLWFHVDGAFGALGILAPAVAHKLQGIGLADSLAFDFHKWGQVPYDAGFVLIRDGELHRKSFAALQSYLERETRGLAAGSPWPCDFSPDLSRGFRALKVWFTFKVYGLDALGRTIARTCELAEYLKQRIAQTPELELLAPVPLNIVCFRYRAANPDRVNAEIAIQLQESGIAAPSTTRIRGDLAIRAAITNHRTSAADLDRLLEATLAFGRKLTWNRQQTELLEACVE